MPTGAAGETLCVAALSHRCAREPGHREPWCAGRHSVNPTLTARLAREGGCRARCPYPAGPTRKDEVMLEARTRRGALLGLAMIGVAGLGWPTGTAQAATRE